MSALQNPQNLATHRRIVIAVALALVAGLVASLLYVAGSYGGPEQPAGLVAVAPDPDPLEPSLIVDLDEEIGEVPQTPTPTSVSATPEPATPEPSAPAPAPDTPAPTTPEPDTPEPEPDPTTELTDEEEDAIDPGPGVSPPDGNPLDPAEEIVPELPEPEPVPDPVDLDPVDGIPVDNVCHDVLLWERELFVQTPIVLAEGSLSSTVSIMNCGGDQMDWSAHTLPWVTLDSYGGQLASGHSVELGFTVDASQVDAGAFEFPITVTTLTEVLYSQVHGFRAAVGKDFAGPDSLSNGAPTCSTACIRKAELRASAISTDVTIDIETTTSANLVVMTWPAVPGIRPDGKPTIASPQVKATSNGAVTEMTAILTDLSPRTQYNIIVQAIDGAGNKWVESGKFTTTDIVQPGGKAVAPLGCSVQCINTAMVSFGESPDEVTVDVTTSEPASIVAQISTQAPFYSAGVPEFGVLEVAANSTTGVTTWTDSLPVTPGTLYHIIVSATDGAGETSYQVGAFNSQAPPPPPPPPETFDVAVTLLRLTVNNDGDRYGRGELTFPWQVGQHEDYRPEERMGDGDSFFFPQRARYHFHDLHGGDLVPLIAVTAWERDPRNGGNFEFDGTPFVRINPDHGLYSHGHMHNTAYVNTMTIDQVAELGRCEIYGIGGAWAEHRCMRLTPHPWEYWDFPTFEAIVAIQVADELAA